MLLLYVHQWTRVWTHAAWTQIRFAQIGAGIGIFLMLLHTLTDYKLHIPANVFFFAFLAGIFFADPAQPEQPAIKRRRKRQTPKLADREQALPATANTSAEPASQIKNPFLD